MAFAGGDGRGLRAERGRAAVITRTGTRRWPSSSFASTTAEADGRRSPTRPLDRPGMAAAIIDLPSSGDELHSAAAAGRGRGDGTSAGTSHHSLPNTSRAGRPLRVEIPPDSTPNLRSAAASSLRPTQARGVGFSEAGLSRAASCPDASCPDACTGCLQCRERKRGTRTPGQAASPLSAARRRTRARISSNEEPLKLTPMTVFNDEGDKCGAPARKSEGSSKKSGWADCTRKCSTIKSERADCTTKCIIIKSERAAAQERAALLSRKEWFARVWNLTTPFQHQRH